MRILYYNNGSGLGTAKSGGTTRQVEITRNLLKDGHSIKIITTIGAYIMYQNEKLNADFILVKASIFKKEEKNNFDRIISYAISTIHTLLITHKLPKCDIVYSPSDYFCDTIPIWFYKKKNKKIKIIVMIHHLCKSPFQRKGNFLINLVSFFGQRFSYFVVKSFADNILVYDTPEGDKIKQYFITKGFDSTNIYSVYNGLNYNEINQVVAGEKKYDACFAGGLRETKGIYDLIPIWEKVVKYKNNAKLIMAGKGTDTTTEILKRKIKEKGLENNIILTGPLDSKNLYKTIKESKIFVSTSHEEGWGIAVCEALACGVPVVAFKLPAFNIFEKYIAQIEKFKYNEFGKKIIEILDNYSDYENLREERKKFIKKYDWAEITKTESEILNNLLLKKE